MVQPFGGVGGLFVHASNLQISPYLKVTRLIPILLYSGAECEHIMAIFIFEALR